MVAVTALVCATSKSSERITHIGTRLCQHKILAEHLGSHIFITITAYWINQIVRDDHLVNNIPIVSVCVSSDTVLEHFPHRVEEVALLYILDFHLGAQVFFHALGGRIIVEVAHENDIGIAIGSEQ